MSEWFLKLLNMSFSAGVLVCVIALIRIIAARKAPKWLMPALWALVGVRLLLFFPLESPLSLLPSAEPIPSDIAMMREPALSTNIGLIDDAVNPVVAESFAPAVGDSVNPLQVWLAVGAVVWLAGMIGMLLYAVISSVLLARRMRNAENVSGRIYADESCPAPFVFGVIRPRIYLPAGLNEEQTAHIVAHEEAHIRRQDHLIKPLGFLLLSVYWFNPLIWLAYILLCRDIEFACDELVVKSMTPESRADYAETLLAVGADRTTLTACPVAFAEAGVKSRVRAALSYRKGAFWIILLGVLVLAALAVFFLTDPIQIKNPWTQEYVPGTGNIRGNVNTEYFSSLGRDYEIGADKYGVAVFKNPGKALSALKSEHAQGIRLIREANDLPPFSRVQRVLRSYRKLGFQTTGGSDAENEEIRAVARVIDIYLNSFENHKNLPAAEPTEASDEAAVGFSVRVEEAGRLIDELRESAEQIAPSQRSDRLNEEADRLEAMVGAQKELLDAFMLEVVRSDLRADIDSLWTFLDTNDTILSARNIAAKALLDGSDTVESSSEDHLFSLPDEVDFSSLDLDGVTSIEIHSGVTGAKTVITEPAEISEIVSLVKGLSASSPESSRGYYGSYASVRLYRADQDLLSFTLGQHETINYLDYEVNHGFLYHARWKSADKTAFDALVAVLWLYIAPDEPAPVN
ncbi:MAG: hypothetical protein IKQ92_15200 [Clostridia bacterium]|nr:hypothetical protein [Clostridia bacterium]